MSRARDLAYSTRALIVCDRGSVMNIISLRYIISLY